MLAHERPHLTQLHRIGTDQERQQASPYRTFDKPSWNDRCLRIAVVHFVVFAWVEIPPNTGLS